MKYLIGTLQRSRGDSLVIRPDNSDTSIVLPMTHVQRIQVSRGLRAHPGTGLGRGLLTGSAAGAVLGFAITPDKNGFIIDTRGEQALVLGVYFGVIGGVVGLIGGAIWKTEDWKTISHDAGRLRIAATSTRSGATCLCRPSAR